MSTQDWDDDRTEMDIPPEQPIGSMPVTFDVPIPTVEQVAGEIARQVMQSESYQSRNGLRDMAAELLRDLISRIVDDKATSIIEELLTKPLQPTDGFGNPVGEPVSLQAVLAQHIAQWASTPVDRHGKPTKNDNYNQTAPRIDWTLGAIVNDRLKKDIDAEVAKIVGTLKTAATNNIAKQIAEKVSGMVLK
jgi:hypothetical protein